VALGAVVGRVRDSEGSFTGASDHHVSEALYLRDPEGNGVEVYADRPQSEWETEPNGGVRIDTLPLHLDDLLAEAASDGRLPTETTVGHVRLKMTALNEAVEFYRAVGFGVQARMFGAAFLVAGDYYHPGLNVWDDRTTPHGSGTAGLSGYESLVPADELDGVVDRLRERGTDVERRAEGKARVGDADRVPVDTCPRPD